MNSRSIVNYAMVGLLSVWVIPTLAQGGEDTGPSGQRLREIIAAYWTDLLKTHPLEATFFVGDQRFSDRLDDPSVEAYQHWLDRLEATQTALNTIDPKTLSADERLDREILRSTIQSRLQARRFGDHLVPLAPIVRYASNLHFPDLHLLFAQLGEFHPASTRGDFENYLLRLKAFPRLADAIIATLKQGMAEGRLAPRVVMPKVLPSSDPRTSLAPSGAHSGPSCRGSLATGPTPIVRRSRRGSSRRSSRTSLRRMPVWPTSSRPCTFRPAPTASDCVRPPTVQPITRSWFEITRRPT